VGVLVATDGSLRLESTTPAPRELTDADTSIDFPATARALMKAGEASGIGDLDGVILIDAVALEDLVWAIGDVDDEELPEAMSDRTTTTALEIDSFLGNAPPRTAQLHADRVTEILQAFLERRPGIETFALAMAASARDRHLSIYLSERAERPVIRSLGLDGRARPAGDGVIPVVATWRSLGSAHVGALVHTTVRQAIRVQEDGSAAVDAEVLFENDAGTDPPSVLLGRLVGGFPVGTFAAGVTLSLPAGAEQIAAETSRPSQIEVGQDLGLVTVTGSIVVRGGDSATLTVSYVVPDVVRTIDGVNQVVLRVLPQPTLDGVRFQIRLVLPEGASIVSASPGLERRGSSALFSGIRGGPADLELRFGSGEI